MKAVVFTPTSLFRFAVFSIDESWFANFGLPEDSDSLKRVVVDDIIYVLEIALDEDDGPIIVVNQTGDHAVFEPSLTSITAFDRMSTVARRVYSTDVAIPITWRPHYEGTVWSLYAASRGRGSGRRLHFETRPGGRKDLFVFARTDEVTDFDKVPRNDKIYNEARDHLAEAILAPAQKNSQKSTRAGIVLSERLPQGFVPGATLEEWYASKLTDEQRTFVDKPYDGPVRLRGSAGTGKTLALVAKFLRDGLAYEARNENVALGFLTHSHASVDLVNAICDDLDHSGLRHKPGDRKLDIRTLYDLANTYLHFELNQLTPLSLDGREGRNLQFELIEETLAEMAASKVMEAQFNDISSDLYTLWRTAVREEARPLVAGIMNEFASVIDAEGIRAGEERGERYAKGTSHRPVWLMALAQEQDRRFILEVHRRYRRMLGEMKTLSVDQMIADFDSFLDSNRWDRIRDREGYDALFVDELHLFTAIERQTLHKLIKRTFEEDGTPKRPPIFMAYDLKQSPRDTFTQYGVADNNLFTSSTGLQNADLVKLSKVFRYTPEIASFLEDLDASFPAIDIPGEWEAYAGEAQLDNGNKPEFIVYKDDLKLFKSVFDDAVRQARRNPGGGRRVAVLCPSEEIFDKYLPAVSGQYMGKVFPIDSREPATELRHAGKRFIFSMPEYVAGLQFETVFLIHVDAREAPTDAGLGMRRRFISNVYLGSSRAEKTLRLSASRSRGGAADILSLALDRNTLRQVPAP